MLLLLCCNLSFVIDVSAPCMVAGVALVLIWLALSLCGIGNLAISLTQAVPFWSREFSVGEVA